MKQSTIELIKVESRRDTFGYLTEVIQKGRIKPAKYKHYLRMPIFLYEELRNKGIINAEDYFIDQAAFFEFKDQEMTISFINFRQCTDLELKILRYLVKKFAGSCPVLRGGISKL
jgi:aspartyl/asparaginyl-tRNA synthetase